jgi:hypothetical protein
LSFSTRAGKRWLGRSLTQRFIANYPVYFHSTMPQV